ncbi:MAG: PKD domain-containing protein [Thermoplasmatota archaeon]
MSPEPIRKTRTYARTSVYTLLAVILTVSGLTMITAETIGSDQVFAETEPPVADAGDDITGVLMNEVVRLDGSNSTDEDIDNCTWEWVCETYSWLALESSNGPRPSFTVNVTGGIVFELRLTDPEDQVGTDKVTVTVPENKHPIAEIDSPSPGYNYIQNTPVEFSANGSRDPEGRDLSFGWESNITGELSDELSDEKYFTTSLSVLGWHLITLNVSDPNGGWDIEDVEIFIREEPKAPTAVIGGLKDSYFKSDLITLDGSFSSDPNIGDKLNYTWRTNRSSIELGYGEVIDVRLSEGMHNISLTVKDMDGLTAGSWTHVNILNRKPTAVIRRPAIVNVSEEAHLSGFNSRDPDSDELDYLWDFGDGYTAIGMNVTHTWGMFGRYNITLTVSDRSRENSEANATTQIKVNSVPVAVLEDEQEFIVDENFDISANLSYDEDGDPLTYRWDFDQDGEWDSFGIEGTHRYDEEDEYLVTLEVSDGHAWSTVTVTVYIIYPNVAPIAIISNKANEDGVIMVPLEDDRGQILLDGSLSYDPDDDTDGSGDINDDERNNLTYNWDLDTDSDSDGDDITDNDADFVGKSARLTLRQKGTVSVALNVTDPRGLWGRQIIKIEGNNIPEITSTRVDPGQSLLVGYKATFEAIGTDSDREDRSKLAYTWHMGDGAVLKGSEVEHVYSSDGRFRVRLVLTDGNFNDTSEMDIRVEFLEKPRIISPKNNTRVEGEVLIKGSAYPTAGVVIDKVSVSINGGSFIKCKQSGSWESWYYEWETSGREAGTYEITVRVEADGAVSEETIYVQVGSEAGSSGGVDYVMIGIVAGVAIIIIGGAVLFVKARRKKQEEEFFIPPPGPGPMAPGMVPGGIPPGQGLPEKPKTDLPPAAKPPEEPKKKEEPPAARDLRIRCPACTNVFIVEDDGGRPLHMTCTHCGAKGTIDAPPPPEEEKEEPEEEAEEDEEPEPIPIVCPECGGLFELTEMTDTASCPFCGSEGGLDEDTILVLEERFGAPPKDITLKCPRCGEKFDIKEGDTEIMCPHCGIKGNI